MAPRPMPPPQVDLENDDNEVHPDEAVDFDSDDELSGDEALPHRTGVHGRTDRYRSALEMLRLEEIAKRIEGAIEVLSEKFSLDVANLVYYMTLLQGEEADTGRIRYARTAFLHSDRFPFMVRKWRRGRDRVHGKGYSTQAARRLLDKWSVENVNVLINREMRELAPVMRAPIKDLTADKLLELNLQDLASTIKLKAPVLWDVLHSASSTPAQLDRNSYKDHTASIVMMASTCCYGRSHKRCRLQQFNSVYFKASGLAAKVHNTTHAYGITMSHSWVYHLVDKLSDDAKRQQREDVAIYPIFLSQDNLNLGFHVYEQRTTNQHHFESGTAATLFVIPDLNVVWPERKAYQQHRIANVDKFITAVGIQKLELAAAPRLRLHAIHHVLKFLTGTVAFDFDSYEHKHSPIFTHPAPTHQLPIGKAHAVHQYVLDTVHIESASQEGTRQCIDEWMKQLKLDGPEETLRNHPVFQHLLVWIGDQLTTVRVRSIKKDRSEDFNFVQRFDQLVEIFGWFHAQLAEEHSFHKQYYKSMDLFGLRHGFELLRRKGLHSPSVKGPFHHGMQEALWHIAEARFRDLWCVVAKVTKLSDLRSLLPNQLHDLAARIVDNYASTAALQLQKQLPVEEQDDVLMQGILFCRDLLNYIELDDSMKTGDVGRMEDLLPRLLFRFNGGSSSNYAIELLELLQGLQHEWPPELRSFILRYCWLANTTGQEGRFLAFDMLQEHNIRDIKHTFAVHGPFSTWEYIKKLSASIPAQRRIKDHVKAEFNHFRRGKSHTTPEWEKDVAGLQESYRVNSTHVYRPGRHTASSPLDYISLGGDHKKLTATIRRWKKSQLHRAHMY
ncbi:hypothetical protein BC835DRAFT_1345302 [Cytidiella melzeri]|nr:hypothetical protein BC835DRAFT_1345302 [Cytidiella melzeri]